jgi:hypothetical protein
VVAQQGVGARTVDQDVVRLEHGHRLLGGDRGLEPLDGTLPTTLIDQSAQAFFDVLQPAEALIPTLKQGKEARVDRAPEVERLLELAGCEDGADVVAVDFVGAVRRNRVRRQVRRQLHHAGSRVGRPLFVETDGEPFHRLQHRGHEESDRPCADDVDPSYGVRCDDRARICHGHITPWACWE